MKIQLLLLPFVLTTLSITSAGQCPKSGTRPVWDTNKVEFRCADPAATGESAQSAIVPPKGEKGYCKSIREDLQNACPSPDEGKSCKNAAKSIYESCYKSSETSSSGSATPSSKLNKTDSSACMETFKRQQQACQARPAPQRAPGQPYVPDTCMSDAMAAQNRCLANSR